MNSDLNPARPLARRTETDPSIDDPQLAANAPSSDLTARDEADPGALAEFLSKVDGVVLLYAIQVANGDAQVELGKEEIQLKREQVEALFQKIQEAIRAAQEAAKNKGFFGELFDKFGVVGKVAVLVAAAASVMATGGASLIAVAALAGTLCSTFSGELAQLAGGSELAEKIFRYGGMGLAMGAGAVGLWQAFATSGGVVASAGGQTALKEIATKVSQGANFVQAGATAAQAGTGYVRDRYAAEEIDARADEKDLRTDRAAELRQIEQWMEFLKEVHRSFNTAKDTLRKAMEFEDAGNLTLANLGARA